MGLPKNRTNNPNGRPKGVPNKTTDELRSVIQSFIEVNIDQMQTDFDGLEPSQRLNFLERMLRHVLPAPLYELQRLSDGQLDELINRLKDDNKIRKIS